MHKSVFFFVLLSLTINNFAAAQFFFEAQKLMRYAYMVYDVYQKINPSELNAKKRIDVSFYCVLKVNSERRTNERINKETKHE